MARFQAGMGQRALWAFSAQAISSVSSFVLTLSVLAAASGREFATFSLCFTTFLLISQLSRAASDLPIMVLYSDAENHHRTSEHQSAVGVAVAIGLLSLVVLGVTGAVMGTGGNQFLILAGGMPLLLFQQAVRHLAFAKAKPHLAAVSDAIWLGLQISGSLLVWWQGRANAVMLLLVWVIAGSVAGLAVGVGLGVGPAWTGSLKWLRTHAGICKRLVFEFAVNSGSYYLLMYGLAFLAGIGELGNLRAAQTFIGPVVVLLLAGHALGIPESVRMRQRGRSMRDLALVLSAGLAVVAVTWGVVIYVGLPWVGPRFFSETWAPARELIPVLSIFAAGVGLSTGPTAGLRALRENAWMLKARAASGAAAVVIGLPAAALIGASGILVALALTELGFAAAAWLRLRSATPHQGGDGEELEAYIPY